MTFDPGASPVEPGRVGAWRGDAVGRWGRSPTGLPHTERRGCVMEITYGTVLAVPIEEAFAFVSDPTTWPLFFPGVEVESLDAWGAPAGRARVTTRFMGRRVHSELELSEWEAPFRFRYVMRQEGRPSLDNLRVFEEIPEGTRLTGTTVVVLRSGVAGLGDRLAAVVGKRVYDRAMRNLAEAVQQHRRTG
jgi:carbon monoxide dehydrogenase subunit G